MPQILQVKRGDIIVQKQDYGFWSVIKILEVDVRRDGTRTAHCLVYDELPVRPDVAALQNADFLAAHSPTDAADFEYHWELIGNEPPSMDELERYHSYLEQTDPAKYKSVMRKCAQAAKDHFCLGYEAEQKGDKDAAVAEYTKAIDLWPSLYQAVNNRAVIYMERGDYELALREFEIALKIQPDNGVMFYSKGECCLRIGEKLAEKARAKLDKSAEIFAEGRTRFPEQREYFEESLKKVEAIRRDGI